VYHLSLLVHIVGVVALVGNIVTAAYWKLRADRTGELRVIAHAADLVSGADRVFTIPGIVLIVVGGTGMVLLGPWRLLQTHWLLAAIALFILTGLLYSIVLVPVQRALIVESHRSLNEGALNQAYLAASRRWAIWGGVVTLMIALIIVLMVFKPDL
jgi:uncharacterized membrane protein